MKEPQTVVALLLHLSHSPPPPPFQHFNENKIVKLAYFICLCVYALYCDFQFHCEYFNKQLSFLLTPNSSRESALQTTFQHYTILA